ncbi:hypothetical protein [Geomonas sp. RF6]|nr:hypothetical protein [Geomonas sp. RF6]
MPKQLSEQELRQIENVVAAAPHGVTISDLEAALAAGGLKRDAQD